MAGIHRLKHVERFLAPAFAEDDAFGPHAQRVLDEFALPDFSLALDVGRSRLHARDVRLLQLQFGRVLDSDQSLALGNEGRERVQHRRLAGTGAARDDRRDPRRDRGGEKLGHLELTPTSTSRSRPSSFFENFRIETSGPSTAMGRTATLTREPSSSRASQSGCSSSTRRPTPATILLTIRRRCASSAKRTATGSQPFPFDIDAFVPVDQNVADRRIAQQWLERAKSDHFVEDLGGKLRELLRGDRQPLLLDQLRHDLEELRLSLLRLQRFERREIDLLDQLLVQTDLGVQQPLLRKLRQARRLGRRDRGRSSGLRRRRRREDREPAHDACLSS